VRDDEKLTPRQERFVDHYLENGGNSAAAAREAGYAEGSAKVTGCRLLTKANLKQTIEGKRHEMSQNSEDRRAKWISHLEHLALSAEKESDQLRAVETLIKAEGWAQPEKSEVTTYSGNFLADLDLGDEVEPLNPGINSIENKDLH